MELPGQLVGCTARSPQCCAGEIEWRLSVVERAVVELGFVGKWGSFFFLAGIRGRIHVGRIGYPPPILPSRIRALNTEGADEVMRRLANTRVCG